MPSEAVVLLWQPTHLVCSSGLTFPENVTFVVSHSPPQKLFCAPWLIHNAIMLICADVSGLCDGGGMILSGSSSVIASMMSPSDGSPASISPEPMMPLYELK